MNKTLKLNDTDKIIFTITKEELNKFKNCYCDSLKYMKSSGCFTLSRFTYETSWVQKFTQLIPMDCYGVYEQHEDTYIHFITKGNLAEVLKTKELKIQENSDLYFLGKGVYAFQVNSGMVFKDLDAIVFKTDTPHIHCFSDIEGEHFGEILFTQNIKLNDILVIPKEETKIFVEKYYNSNYALTHCYGIKPSGEIPLNELRNYLLNNA